MAASPQPPFRTFVPSLILLIIIGWGSSAIAIFLLTPTIWARWLLFFGGTLGLTAVGLPIAWFFNLRFPSQPPVQASIILRQAIWLGVYWAILTWLQQERLVSIWTGFGLAAGLFAIEYLIRMRENARWQPSPNDLDPDGQSEFDDNLSKE